VWLNQKQLAELFGVTVPTINEHIGNIYKEDELNPDPSTIRKFLIVQNEGTREVKREIDHFSLDMILSVGYRIKSRIATKFRQWATQTLNPRTAIGASIKTKKANNIPRPSVMSPRRCDSDKVPRGGQKMVKAYLTVRLNHFRRKIAGIFCRLPQSIAVLGLKDHIVKGYTLNESRLKSANSK
jgi:hypothetical protein